MKSVASNLKKKVVNKFSNFKKYIKNKFRGIKDRFGGKKSKTDPIPEPTAGSELTKTTSGELIRRVSIEGIPAEAKFYEDKQVDLDALLNTELESDKSKQNKPKRFRTLVKFSDGCSLDFPLQTTTDASNLIAKDKQYYPENAIMKIKDIEDTHFDEFFKHLELVWWDYDNGKLLLLLQDPNKQNTGVIMIRLDIFYSVCNPLVAESYKLSQSKYPAISGSASAASRLGVGIFKAVSIPEIRNKMQTQKLDEFFLDFITLGLYYNSGYNSRVVAGVYSILPRLMSDVFSPAVMDHTEMLCIFVADYMLELTILSQTFNNEYINLCPFLKNYVAVYDYNGYNFMNTDQSCLVPSTQKLNKQDLYWVMNSEYLNPFVYCNDDSNAMKTNSIYQLLYSVMKQISENKNLSLSILISYSPVKKMSLIPLGTPWDEEKCKRFNELTKTSDIANFYFTNKENTEQSIVSGLGELPKTIAVINLLEIEELDLGSIGSMLIGSNNYAMEYYFNRIKKDVLSAYPEVFKPYDIRTVLKDRQLENEQKKSRQNQNGKQKPTQNQDGEQEPTQNQDGEQEPTQNQDGKQEPTQNQDDKQEPTQNQDGEQEPTQNQDGEQEPTQNQDGKQEPSQNQDGKQEPSQDQDGKQEPSRN